MIFYCLAIFAGLIIIRLMMIDVIRSPFALPPTPTRSAQSYIQEGAAFFDAGNLKDAVTAYQNAANVDPQNPANWVELARMQTYSTTLILSKEDQIARLTEAQESVKKALKLDQEYGMTWAIQALVLDWSADPNLVDAETRQKYLDEAHQASIKALQLLPNDPIALAFQAEVLVDQSNWAQALDVGARAVQLAPDNLDVHRAYAYVLESNGLYNQAVEEYKIAIGINSNLPFLHLRLGANYRKIGQTTTDPNLSKEMINKAIEEFSRAAFLNSKDPGPYLSIANTYVYLGEFFIAERNATKALSLDRTNPFIYGRLGAIYYQAKNYESAMKVLKCAVRGCSALENEEEGVDIKGVTLAADTADFYYIYGSVLAFYGNEDDNCGQAAAIFTELRASPVINPDIEGIIQEGERICASFSRSTPTP
jgi:tetratricopeptide (TPR) repeat protein